MAPTLARKVADEHGGAPPYSTLTRWVREAELRAASKRAWGYHFGPGQEMQHDTSPHRATVAGEAVTAQCVADAGALAAAVHPLRVIATK